jgi:hypothetical protein
MCILITFFCRYDVHSVPITIKDPLSEDGTNTKFTDSELIEKGFRVFGDEAIVFSSKGSSRARIGRQEDMKYSGITANRHKGEVFSGAFMTHINHVLENKALDPYNSSTQQGRRMIERLYCEDATYFFCHKMLHHKLRNYVWGDIPGQTLDVLDFSVLHLSTIERQLFSRKLNIKMTEKDSELKRTLKSLGEVYNAQNATQQRLRMIGTQKDAENPTQASDVSVQNKLDRTVVVIPFIMRHAGSGNSRVRYRHDYLHLTFWSLYPYFKHIVAVVKYPEDFAYAKNESGLPFYDVMMISHNGERHCALPVLSIVEARSRVRSGSWAGFEYFYYTEGDQILIVRNVEKLYEWMSKSIYGIVSPHRLAIQSKPYLQSIKRSLVSVETIMPDTIHSYACCLDTGYGQSRVHWKHISDHAVELVNYAGVYLALGNSNFFSQKYRGCNLTRSSDRVYNGAGTWSSRVYTPICQANPVHLAFSIDNLNQTANPKVLTTN